MFYFKTDEYELDLMINFDQFTSVVNDNNLDYESLLPLYYHFDFNKIPFECQILSRDDDNSYIVNLTAKLGFLPYSSENRQKRQKILKNFQNLMQHRLIIMDHHCNMTFPIETSITGQLNAKIMMEAIVYTLLDVEDILSIITNTLENPTAENKKHSASL